MKISVFPSLVSFIYFFSLIPCAISFIKSSSSESLNPPPSEIRISRDQLNIRVREYYRNNFVENLISLDVFDQFLYTSRSDHFAEYELIESDPFSPAYLDTTCPRYRTTYYPLDFSGFNGRLSYLKYLDAFNLLLFEMIFNNYNKQNPTFIEYLKVLINHIPDLKATFFPSNSSVLSLLSIHENAFNIFRGRLDRPELEYNAYFEPLKIIFSPVTAGDNERKITLKPYLLSLALFTPQIQVSVIKECLSICSKSKKLLLHLLLIYRLDEQVFDYLVNEMDANLNNLTDTKNPVSRIFHVTIDDFESIPKFIFSNPSAKYKIFIKSFYSIPDSDVRRMIMGTKEVSLEKEKNFICGMLESGIKTNRTSFKSAFNLYNERIVKLLIGMVPNNECIKKDLNYHLAHLIITSPNVSIEIEYYKNHLLNFLLGKDGLVDRKHGHFLLRFSQGESDVIAIALLLTFSKDQVIELIRLYKSNRHGNMNIFNNIAGSRRYFKNTINDVILAACKLNLHPEAFKILIENHSFLSLPESIESLLRQIRLHSKSEDFQDKIAFLEENLNRIKSDLALIFEARWSS